MHLPLLQLKANQFNRVMRNITKIGSLGNYEARHFGGLYFNRTRYTSFTNNTLPFGVGATGDIHVTKYKSYHTTTPNGYDLQISNGTRETRTTR